MVNDQVRHLTNGVIELRGILGRNLGDGVISGAEGGGMEGRKADAVRLGIFLLGLALALESLGSWRRRCTSQE
jgi:hypothetical protein